MGRAAPIDLGRYDTVKEVPGPRMYEVRTGKRYLHGLEDGEVRSWRDYHAFTLDERTGQINITGDFGLFSYCWSRGGLDGEPLHSFLYTVDFDYFMTKASAKAHRVYDHERTVRELFKQLIERRREDGNWAPATWNKDRVRAMWNDLDEWQHAYEGDRFIAKLFDDTDWSEFLDYCDPSYTKEHEGLRRFWDDAWAVFRREVLLPHWLDYTKRTPIPRRRALVLVC